MRKLARGGLSLPRALAMSALAALGACAVHASLVSRGEEMPASYFASAKEEAPASSGRGGASKAATARDRGRPEVAKTAGAASHPLAQASDAELERRLLQDKAALGPVSLGQPNAGLLWNGVKMPEGPRWIVQHPERSWGTPETVRFIAAAIDEVHEQHPRTPKLYVGNLSKEGGGRFGEHLSHRSGRDVDLGFYYTENCLWYTEATLENLDIPRTWALIRALVTETDLELIVIDRSLHWHLRAHARKVGDDPAWVRSLFVRGPPPEKRLLIQHREGHKTHMHVRFFNRVAQTTGHRVYPLAIKNELFNERYYYVKGWAKRTDTRESFLKRYGTSLPSFGKANGWRAGSFRPGRYYKILRYGPVDPGEGPPVFLPRLLPPR